MDSVLGKLMRYLISIGLFDVTPVLWSNFGYVVHVTTVDRELILRKVIWHDDREKKEEQVEVYRFSDGTHAFSEAHFMTEHSVVAILSAFMIDALLKPKVVEQPAPEKKPARVRLPDSNSSPLRELYQASQAELQECMDLFVVETTKRLVRVEDKFKRHLTREQYIRAQPDMSASIKVEKIFQSLVENGLFTKDLSGEKVYLGNYYVKCSYSEGLLEIHLRDNVYPLPLFKVSPGSVSYSSQVFSLSEIFAPLSLIALALEQLEDRPVEKVDAAPAGSNSGSGAIDEAYRLSGHRGTQLFTPDDYKVLEEDVSQRSYVRKWIDNNSRTEHPADSYEISPEEPSLFGSRFTAQLDTNWAVWKCLKLEENPGGAQILGMFMDRIAEIKLNRHTDASLGGVPHNLVTKRGCLSLGWVIHVVTNLGVSFEDAHARGLEIIQESQRKFME